jgi:hypothetical protein
MYTTLQNSVLNAAGRAAARGCGYGRRARIVGSQDDSATAQSIGLMLKSERFNVHTTNLGEEGVDLGRLHDYDIIAQRSRDEAARLQVRRPR